LLWREQFVEGASVHEVCAHEPGEGEWSVDDFLGRLGQTEDEIGDQRYGDLDAHRIFGYAEEALDLQGLFDPAEE
jgi:hypothetical protein